MKLFRVKKGEEVKVLPPFKEMTDANIKKCVLSRDVTFEVEQISIDPVRPKHPRHVVGSTWEKAGWYGFKQDGWLMLVPGRHISIL